MAGEGGRLYAQWVAPVGAQMVVENSKPDLLVLRCVDTQEVIRITPVAPVIGKPGRCVLQWAPPVARAELLHPPAPPQPLMVKVVRLLTAAGLDVPGPGPETDPEVPVAPLPVLRRTLAPRRLAPLGDAPAVAPMGEGHSDPPQALPTPPDPDAPAAPAAPEVPAAPAAPVVPVAPVAFHVLPPGAAVVDTLPAPVPVLRRRPGTAGQSTLGLWAFGGAGNTPDPVGAPSGPRPVTPTVDPASLPAAGTRRRGHAFQW